MNETTKSVLKDIVLDIVEQLDEIKLDKKNPINDGQNLAYVDVLKTISTYADDDEKNEIGLNFDIDKKYL